MAKHILTGTIIPFFFFYWDFFKTVRQAGLIPIRQCKDCHAAFNILLRSQLHEAVNPVTAAEHDDSLSGVFALLQGASFLRFLLFINISLLFTLGVHELK